MADPKSFFLSAEVHDYLVGHGAPPDATLVALAEETAALGAVAEMQVAPEQGALLTMLTRLTGATRAVEVGTFTGYSAICIARGLRPGGRLLCCDISEEWTAVARRHWEVAGVADRIDLVLGPAAETLAAARSDDEIDFAFIDADKQGYRLYYDEIMARVRPGGLVVVDNVLWSGRVVDPSATDPQTEAIRAFNDHVAADPTVHAVMLPVSDGLTLVQKRA